jgi:LacI family transcriptional regulator
MAESRQGSDRKKIAVAIEMDEPYPHHYDRHRGIMAYAQQRPDWELVVDPYLMGADTQAGAREYAGVVGRIDEKMAADARAAGVAVVNLWLNSPAKGLAGVYADVEAAGQMAAEHLLARGYRQIGYVGLKGDCSDGLFLAGYEPAVQARGMKVPKIRFPLSLEKRREGFSAAYRRLHKWISGFSEPAGLFVPMDSTALYVVQICHRLGLRVPHDVGVVTYFNNHVICLGSSPTISSVEPDNHRAGYQAAALLDRLMAGEPVPDEPIWVPPPTLRARGSSDAFVSKDALVSEAMRHITEHSNQALTVSEVAKAVGTSKPTLVRRFEKHVGRSVHEEIARVRVAYIKRALLDTAEPLTVVAGQCGFANNSHFTEFFKKVTGITPGEYRRQHQP